MKIISKHLYVYNNIKGFQSTNAIVNCKSFKSKIKRTGKIPSGSNTIDVQTSVSLKHFSNFWRALEMPWIICKINLILTWSTVCVISSTTGETNL